MFYVHCFPLVLLISYNMLTLKEARIIETAGVLINYLYENYVMSLHS